MRAHAILLFFAVSALACSETERADDSRIISNEAFKQDLLWDRAPAGWASSPTLVIARRDGIYPEAPDVDVQLTCQPTGYLRVSGNEYSVATDVGGPPALKTRFQLRSNAVSLSGEPIWEHGGFSKEAHIVLKPTAEQLAQLITGEWFEVVGIFADGSGTVRYPPPPRPLAIQFLQDCGHLVVVR